MSAAWAWALIGVGVGAFAQASTGFGMGLLAMPLLVGALGLGVSQPLMAVVAVVLQTVMVVRYRQALRPGTMSLLVVAGLVGTPLGVSLKHVVNEQLLISALGVVVVGYALYGLTRPALPPMRAPGWALGFGLCSGLLSGAYNVGGPPAVIYGDARGWTPTEFKSNLQGFFLVKMLLLLGTHAAMGHFTLEVWGAAALVLPVALAGMLLGFALDGRLNPRHFRSAMLALLLLTGLLLLWPG